MYETSVCTLVTATCNG